MEKPYRIILIAILVLLGVQLIFNLFVISPNLKTSLQKMEAAQHQLDSARRLVHESRSRIDSIQVNILKFNNYLISIQSQTEVMYQERALREARFKNERDSIRTEMDRLTKKLEEVQLPDLEVYDTNTNEPK
jgi:hypothetical protein